MRKSWPIIILLGVSNVVYAQAEPWSFDFNVDQVQGQVDGGTLYGSGIYGMCLYESISPLLFEDWILYEEGNNLCRDVAAPSEYVIEQTLLGIQEGSLSFGIFDTSAQVITVTPTKIGVKEIFLDPNSPWALFNEQPVVADIDASTPHAIRLIREISDDASNDVSYRVLVDGVELLRFDQGALTSTVALHSYTYPTPYWELEGKALIGLSPYGQATVAQQVGWFYVIGSSQMIGEEDEEADVDGDGLVGMGDLLEIISSWGGCPGMPEPCPADFAAPMMTVGIPELLGTLGSWD
jgi:hypothetical protein